MQAVQIALRSLSNVQIQKLPHHCLKSLASPSLFLQNCLLHTTAELEKEQCVPKKWPTYNEIMYPPQTPDEERRPAFVCHMKTNIKYSPDKMWYVACLVRGMTVEEALKQLTFVHMKGAIAVRQTILEAQQLAVDKHCVEYKTNLWVAESFSGKGFVVKGVRRHARGRMGMVMYKYCHYFVRLEEGKPPADYYNKPLRDGPTLLGKWLDEMRRRYVNNSL